MHRFARINSRYTISPLIALATLFVTAYIQNSELSAQTQPSEISIGHTPQAEYINLQPGETYEGKFTVWNLAERDFTYYIIVRGFEQVEDYAGTSIPLSEEEDRLAPYSASDWVTVDRDEIDLVSNRNIDINYTITVPEDTDIGGYNAKIFLSTDNLENSDTSIEAVLNLGTGPSLLINVGDLSELEQKADLLRFESTEWYFDSSEASLETVIDNTGNTYFTPTGEIQLTNIFGQELARLDFNPEERSQFRDDQSRYINRWRERYLFTDDWKLAAGPINAKLIMTYTAEDPGYNAIIAETNYWIIPWQVVLAIIMTIITLYTAYKIRKQTKSTITEKGEK